MSPIGQFVLRCTYSHTLADDPIVFPAQPGASHVHDFFGNTEAVAFSTVESMLAGETTCRVPSDTAGYWSPQACLNGVPIEPTVMRIYYLGPRTGTVETIPPGLQMIGGESHAASPEENPHVSWNCGQTKAVKTPQEGLPCCCTPWVQHAFVDGIVASSDFPSCWNATGLLPDDGQQYHHRYDAFLRRYNAAGNELWTRQFGTNGVDQALAIFVVGSDVYVAGSTTGRFPKQELREASTRSSPASTSRASASGPSSSAAGARKAAWGSPSGGPW